MTVPGAAARFIYLFDPSADTTPQGWDLTSVDGQVGAFDPPGFEESMTDMTGSASVNPVQQPSGHAVMGDFDLPIWADSSLQDLLDDISGVTAADRTAQRILVIGWMGADAIGQLAEFGRVYLKTAKPAMPAAQLTLYNTTWTYTQLAHIGTTLHAMGAETADGNTEASSQDNTASSANGATCAWGYTALNLDGGTAFAPRVIDSSDDITFGSLVAFAAVTATGGGGEISAVTGTVERYVAFDWDFTGTPGGSATCTFWGSFERNA